MKLGIIGMGFGAQVHLPALLSNKNIEISAIADSGSGSAQQIANAYGLDISVYKSGEDLLKDNKIDMVTIATPAKAQSMLIKEAIRQGKHVVCEKPFTTSKDEVNEIISFASKKKIHVVPAYSFRYDSGINLLIKLIEEGTIGEVLNIDVKWLTSGGLSKERLWTWRDDINTCGGVLNDWCCHVIDYCSLISKSDVQRVHAKTSIKVKSRNSNDGILKEVTAPDLCKLELVYANEIKAKFLISNTSVKSTGHYINIKGREGELIYNHAPPFTDKTYSLKINKKNKTNIIDVIDIDSFNDQRVSAFAKLINDVTNKINTGDSENILPDLVSAQKNWSVLSAAEGSRKFNQVLNVQYQ